MAHPFTYKGNGKGLGGEMPTSTRVATRVHVVFALSRPSKTDADPRHLRVGQWLFVFTEHELTVYR